MTHPSKRRDAYAVWEITLACNLRCQHCGSRAGKARPNELSTAEALDLVHQLADFGVREVTLIGGEAFLRRDWLEIAAEIKACGMRLTMTTGGYGLGPKLAARMAEVGFDLVGVSVDGLRGVHDSLRGRKNSWAWCFAAFEALRDVGIPIAANTQINRRSVRQLPRIYARLRDAGVRGWQTQLTVPMGNAADRPELLLQPVDLLAVFPVLHYLYLRGQDEGVAMMPGNNVGYFGPYERRLRSHPKRDDIYEIWAGSMGGVTTLGIEADGTIKADPSLPTQAFAGGNIRAASLRTIVEQAEQLCANDERGTEHMWGFCGGCEHAQLCRGGDAWTASVVFDRTGNNPYCHHRTLHHAARGLRERLVQRERAVGVPFDNGRFEAVVDALGPADPDDVTLDQIEWPQAWLDEDPELLARLARERDAAIEYWRRTRIGARPAARAAAG
jgi:radical SAM protein with 4Fe4S-binding SPASM domain